MYHYVKDLPPMRVTADTPEHRFDMAADKLAVLVAKGHWSDAETSARIRDARDAGRFEAYREICTALIRDCESERCEHEGCAHERLLEAFHAAMLEGGRDGRSRPRSVRP